MRRPGAVEVALPDVSRETRARLDTYADLLVRWNDRINLVSRSTLPDLWNRHIADSAQLAGRAPPGPLRWADFGSGAGFPGLVVAILRPEVEMILVESDRRKCAFLGTVARETDTSVDIRSARVDDIPPLAAKVVSARALAPLDVLLGYAHRHLAPEGLALFLKGATCEAEIFKALETWSFRCERTPSVTDPAAVILKLSEIARA